MRYRRAPASDRRLASDHLEPGVLPRPRTVGTSLGSLSWLCESPATPVLAPRGPEPMVELLVARFTKYHSSLVSWSFLCPGLARDTMYETTGSGSAEFESALKISAIQFRSDAGRTVVLYDGVILPLNMTFNMY
jgi:hypothetical protein